MEVENETLEDHWTIVLYKQVVFHFHVSESEGTSAHCTLSIVLSTSEQKGLLHHPTPKSSEVQIAASL